MSKLNRWILSLCVLVTLGCDAQQVDQSAEVSISSPAAATTSSNEGKALEMPIAASYQAGKDYDVLSQPVPTADRDKIEIAEVFWYGCGHCFTFEPILEEWAASLPADVAFFRSPAMWDQQGVMQRHARIYYTAKALGILDKAHNAAFEALNLDKKPLRTDEEVAEFFKDLGVSREQFDKVFNSFGITSAVTQAEARQRSYRIQGTPELIVNGKYRVTARQAGSQEAMLSVANYLIAQERQSAAQN